MGRALAPDYRTHRATAGDAAELAAFIWAAWNAVDHDETPFTAVSDDWIRATASLRRLQRRLDSDDSAVMVVRAADAIVGVAATSTSDDGSLEITELVVHPLVEHTGVGTSLLDETVRHARRRHASRVVTHAETDDAWDFFVRRGFRAVDETMLERPLAS